MQLNVLELPSSTIASQATAWTIGFYFWKPIYQLHLFPPDAAVEPLEPHTSIIKITPSLIPNRLHQDVVH